MNSQNKIQEILQEKFRQMQNRNPRYSLRSFSQKIGMSPGSLSQILNGKRKVSKNLSREILTKLSVSRQEVREVEALYSTEDLRVAFQAKSVAMGSKMTLEKHQEEIVSDWTHYAILSLMETKDFKSDPSWMAQRLNISESHCLNSLSNLEKAGYLKKVGTGYEICDVSLQTTDDVISAALRQRHHENLAAAKVALQEIAIDMREFSSMTMAIDLKTLPLAKSLIREFKEKLCNIMEVGEQTEVYELSIQLFPRSTRWASSN